MGRIDRCVEGDIPAVADLFMRVFREKRAPASAALTRCFIDLYLGNPWYDEKISSLVYRNDNGIITGFLGVIPRHFTFGGKRITVAVGGNHMVDPDRKDPMAGALLLKKLFDGPQDLTLTDTANAISKKLWERAGAVTLHSRSLRWIRLLRPLRFASGYAFRPKPVKWLLPGASLLSLPGDALLSRLSPFCPPRGTTLEPSEPGVESLVKGMDSTSPDRLEPLYTIENMTWLLNQSRLKKEHGDLHISSWSKGGTYQGWSAFYTRPGGIAQLLRIASSKGAYGQILDSLIAGAARLGASAVMGDVDPLHTEELIDRQALIFLRRPYTMAYSRNPELVRALESNRATLTRLEGEWWTRLQGDPF